MAVNCKQCSEPTEDPKYLYCKKCRKVLKTMMESDGYLQKGPPLSSIGHNGDSLPSKGLSMWQESGTSFDNITRAYEDEG